MNNNNIYIYTILLSNKKEYSTETCYMFEPWKHYANK